MKKTTKTTKKKKSQPKYDYVLDFSKIESYQDLVKRLIRARVAAGKTIDSSDLRAYEKVIEPDIHVYFVDCGWQETKKPWYKRFWNWLTHKK